MTLIKQIKTVAQKSLPVLGGAALLTLGNACTAIAASFYSITDLGTLGSYVPPGDDTFPPVSFSHAYGINNRGQVVGASSSSDGNRAFRWSLETGMESLGILNDSYGSEAWSINDNGDVAGTAYGSNGSRAFLWKSDTRTIQDLGLPIAVAYGINNSGQVTGMSGSSAFLWSEDTGCVRPQTCYLGRSTEAHAINNSGQVVGMSFTSNGGRAFLWSKETGIQDLDTVADNFSRAYGINDNGQVVGDWSSGDNRVAFLWNTETRTMRSLGILDGYYSSVARAINNKGQAVGWLQGENVTSAFLWNDDKMIELNSLIDPNSGWVLQEARDINDRGQIVGMGINAQGQTRAFLLTPEVKKTPEPTSILSMLLVAGCIGSTSWQKRRRIQQVSVSSQRCEH